MSATVRPPLFRAEVAERNWEALASRGLLPRPPRMTLAAIVLLTAAFVVGATLLARGALPKVEFAPGYIEPTGGVVRVHAPRQGFVGTVHVEDGELVARGDPLVTLQSGQTTEAGVHAEEEIAVQLGGQRDNLMAQIAAEGLWRETEERRLGLSIAESLSNIEMFEQTAAVQRQQLVLAAEHAERIREAVKRRTVPLDELQRRDMAVLDHRLAVQATEREIAARRAQLALARVSLEQLPMTTSERARSLRNALADVQQRLIELETRRAVVIRAPHAGRVAAIPARAGASVDTGSLIATIVPDGRELRARVLVPTRAIGNVHTGQAVSIRYEAFPYLKYGSFNGRVVEVSSAVLMPQEVARIAPVRLDEPAYLLEVSIDRQSVRLDGEREAVLRPDMLLAAAIEVDRRPLLAMIGESVFGVAQP